MGRLEVKISMGRYTPIRPWVFYARGVRIAILFCVRKKYSRVIFRRRVDRDDVATCRRIIS